MDIVGGYDRWHGQWVVRAVDAWGRVRSTHYAKDRPELNKVLLALRRKHGWRIATSSRWLDWNAGRKDEIHGTV